MSDELGFDSQNTPLEGEEIRFSVGNKKRFYELDIFDCNAYLLRTINLNKIGIMSHLRLVASKYLQSVSEIVDFAESKVNGKNS